MPSAIFPPDLTGKANWHYAEGLGRALAGSIIFSLPILMTMEMWALGFYLDRVRLLQFVAVNLVVLVGLSRVSGFEETRHWFDDVLDAFAAYGIAAIASFIVLILFGVIEIGMSANEVIGKVAIESVPASFGAMLAGKELASRDRESREKRRERSSYRGQLFLMGAGALFLAFNVAPTEEMQLISFRMSPWHSLALAGVSILLLHALVYTVGFRGEPTPADGAGFASVFLRYSVVGYAIASLVSLYLLWTFGRTEGAPVADIVAMVVVLAFPGAIGAAIARLVI